MTNGAGPRTGATAWTPDTGVPDGLVGAWPTPRPRPRPGAPSVEDAAADPDTAVTDPVASTVVTPDPAVKVAVAPQPFVPHPREDSTPVSPDIAAAFADLASASAERAATQPPEPVTAEHAPTPPSLTSPLPSLEAATFGLATPDAPTFSPDGRYWYDGTRWTRVETDAPQPERRAPRRRRGLVVALGALVLLVVVLPVLGALVLPALLDQRAGEYDDGMKQALAHTHLAQQNHQMQVGMYTADLEALESALRAPLLPADAPVEVTVLRATVAEYCAAAGVVGDELRFYVDESGEVGRRSCG